MDWHLVTTIILSIITDENTWKIGEFLLLTGITAASGRVAWLKGKTVEIQIAKDAVAAGASELYPVVKALKAANDDNKLTEAQRVEVRDRSLERSVEIGKSVGVNVMKVLGPIVARSVLEQTVSRLKSGSTPKLQPEVAALLPDEPRSVKAVE